MFHGCSKVEDKLSWRGIYLPNNIIHTYQVPKPTRPEYRMISSSS